MKPLLFTALALALITLGVLAARYRESFRLSMPPPAPGSAPARSDGLPEVGPVVRLAPFVVSEVEGVDQRISTVTFEVEVSDTQGRDAVKARASEIRSAILTVLADTKLTDIGDPEDFVVLKRKVQGRVQTVIGDHVVRRILITEFLSL